MDDILHIKFDDIPSGYQNKNDKYEHYKRILVPRRNNGQCAVYLYEIPPKKSACPYHYHTKNEECFYIIQGSGILKTPKGEETVSAGSFLFFPANEKGAHKLTNTSETEMLIYLDFDTHNEIEVAFYPDSNKIGVWGKEINQIYKLQDQVDYYDGE